MLNMIRCLLLLLFFVDLIDVANGWNIPLPGGGRIQLDDGGILRIQLDATQKKQLSSVIIPPSDTKISPTILDCIEVRDTKTIKGYGAYCVNRPIPKHAFLGFYEGTVINSRDELDSKRRHCDGDNNYMDYIMSVDGGATFIDGYDRAQNYKQFSPVHLNHADRGDDDDNDIIGPCNCMRLLEKGKVAFFTKREIQVGEELCFDYGKDYWSGRETEKI